ncbi:hypothetical protein Pcinc_022598 [Petrolisthes cinctipes]|uniref:C2H2-type domain-containing protein n=1 Tax=Petrolisthes cinctipes TaxID=88211 RepID=A0AAE1FDJ8_PETCI|nr:hypothetical protein Pcinc_022598 [Petrolisthes cinctipes]
MQYKQTQHSEALLAQGVSPRRVARLVCGSDTVCPLCRKTFSYPESMIRHCQGHLPTAHRLRCAACGKTFHRKDQFKYHQARCEARQLDCETLRFTLRCRCCDKSFSNRSNLQRHLASQANYRPYSCPVCSKAFARKDVLKRHITKHNLAHTLHTILTEPPGLVSLSPPY